jgi:hypothetical protein
MYREIPHCFSGQYTGISPAFHKAIARGLSGSVSYLLNWSCVVFYKSLHFSVDCHFHFFFPWFLFLYISLFAAAMMSAKMVIPTANSVTFVVIPNAHTRLFMQNIPTTVANLMSRNRFCNGRQMEQAFERHHDVSVSVA